MHLRKLNFLKVCNLRKSLKFKEIINTKRDNTNFEKG